MNRKLTAPLLLLAATATPEWSPAQASPATPTTPGAVDWRMPFRSPQAPLVPPEAMYRQLRKMYAIATKADPARLSRDEQGILIVDDPDWAAARDALDQVGHDAGYLSLVMRDSRSDGDRAIAFHGMIYVPDPDLVFQLVEHIPGEPLREIREAAFQHATPYVVAHLPLKHGGDLDEWRATRVGPAGEPLPKPGEFRHGFDPAPFFALLGLDDPVDRRQALWFLARCAEARPSLADDYLAGAHDALRKMLADGDQPQRDAVVDFLAAIDPDADREPADAEDPEAIAEWLAAIHYDVFPPIRRVSEGRFELHPGADRDAVLAVGQKALADGTLGAATAVKTESGGPQRGFKIAALPEPLDRLGIGIGDAIVAIDGRPVATAADLDRVLKAQVRRGRTVLVEFVDRTGAHRAIDYVIY